MKTQPRLESLLSPFQMGDLSLKNRVVLAPLTRGRAGDSRLANPLMAEYYSQRAGAGLIITEATSVSPQGNGWVGAPGIYTNEQSNSWKQVADAVHEKGSRVFMQLWHTGRASHSSFHDGALPVAPSAIAMKGEGVHTSTGKQPHEVPRALETSEMPGIVADYVAAAKRAKDAGMDGIEIHAANGYLLDEFLQSSTNKREDVYGGSVENRFRLLKEIVEGIIEVLPATRVGVRLSPNGVYGDMGSADFREDFLYIAEKLNEYGLAYLHVIDGLGFGFHELGEAMTLTDFKAVFSGPLMGNCGYDEHSANEKIAAGSADLIAIGRPYITNPDLVERYQNDWPIAPLSDPASWFLASTSAEGYTDFPNYLHN